MERTELGCIQAASFGYGGYQDAMIGLSISLAGKSWGVSDFKGAWGIDRSKYAKWSEEDRVRELGEACIFLRDLLRTSGKRTVTELVGVPIEATFEGTLLKGWRVLTEVLQVA